MGRSADVRPPREGDILRGTDYRIHRFLGAGATAEVYEATSPKFGRCALKLLSPRYTARSTIGARFRLEARLLAELHHPSLVDVLDFGAASGRFYLAMPLLRGTTLRERAADRVVTWRQAVGLAVDVLDGLAVAHDAGVVHRDIKPDNIFLCHDGTTKIIDFGIAKVEDRSIITEPGLVVGTPAYMSPEQVVGGSVDGRSDVYSVGVVLYELLAGRRPFPGDQPGPVAAMRVKRDPPPLAQFASSLPALLSDAVDRALRHALDRRFGSALDFAVALRAAVDLDMDSAPDTPLPHSEPGVSRSAPTRTSVGAAETNDANDSHVGLRNRSSPPASQPLESTVVSAGTERRPAEAKANKLHFVAWDDVFVLIDYGNATAADYVAMGDRVVAAAAKYPAGFGGLIIVPRHATPPPAQTREAMTILQQRLSPLLRCLCWYVEGQGFQGAMVRAVLTGARALRKLPYESHIAANFEEALTWIVRRLDGDGRRLARIGEAAEHIARARARSETRAPK